MDIESWITRFAQNRERLFEPGWSAPCQISDSGTRCALSRSLSIFQLGETGGGTRLRRFVARFVGSGQIDPRYAEAVELFIAEEHVHADILAKLVAHLGGEPMRRNWTNSIFRSTRGLLRLEFSIQLLVTAEVIADAYYGLLAKNVPDATVRACCRKILHDEMGHIGFHASFLHDRLSLLLPVQAELWRVQFQVILATARTAVWHDHRGGLSAVGIDRVTFFAETSRACRSFLGRLARGGGVERGKTLPHLT